MLKLVVSHDSEVPFPRGLLSRVGVGNHDADYDRLLDIAEY
jgi:hypothetical protein